MNHIRPVFLKLAFTVSMLLLASIAVTPAKANLVTFAFEGTVETIGSALLAPGTTFGINSTPIIPMFLSGSYSFESTTPNGINGIPQLGVYSSSISNLTFHVREGSAAPFYSNTPPPPDPSTPNVIIVQNDFLNGVADVYQVKMHFSGPAVNTHAASSFTIDQLSVSPPNNPSLANPFSDNSLPTTPPGLGDLGQNTSFQIIFTGTEATVRGNISSLTLVANPLPPAVILFGAGLVALVGLGAGSWRQRKNGLA